MFLRNETDSILEEIMANEASLLFVIREARQVDTQGVERNRKREINCLLNEKAAEKRRREEDKMERACARRAQLDAIPLERDFARLEQLTTTQLWLQLEKHQLLDPNNIRNRGGNKQELLEKLRAALARYEVNLSSVGPLPTATTEPSTS
jgi:hypothetical protein